MRKIILMLILVSVVLYGCADTGDSGPGFDDPFLGGTDGVIISFEEDAPPEELYDGGDFPFSVVVKLKNEGETKIAENDVVVTISGILASEFNKQENELVAGPSEDLEATRKDSEGNVVDGIPVYVELGDFNHIHELTGNTPYTIRADVCYKYTTTANAMICVRKDNLDTKEGVCIVNEDKAVYCSGAPLQVTEFKEMPRAKDKIGFMFTISHKGNGQIYQQASKCDTSSRSFENKVWLEVESGIPGLECSGLNVGTATTGFVTLYGNEKRVTCTQSISTNSDYEKIVTIRLGYDYSESKKTTVLVKHTLG